MFAVIISKGLASESSVVAYCQQHGTPQMLHFCAQNMSKLAQCVQEAGRWDQAEARAASEKESEWELFGRLASAHCKAACEWWAAKESFFARNPHLDPAEVSAAVAQVVRYGPGKTSRVPLLAGPSNAAKSTLFAPVDAVFGPGQVFHLPSIGSSMPLSNLVLKTKRAIYFDDFRPVAYAAYPVKAPTLPVPTQLKLLGGEWFEASVSQSLHLGHVDVRWSPPQRQKASVMFSQA
jgi:hypothetical protein